MGAGNSGFFKGTFGAKKGETNAREKALKRRPIYNPSGSMSVKRVDSIIVSNDLHSIPEHSIPNTVHICKRNGILRNERYFDENGNPYLDIDYTDHGNSKMHPIVPHEHTIEVKNGKFIRDKKWRKIQK